MISSFDSNVLVYSAAPPSIAKRERAREVIARGIRAGASILLLQTLSEFSYVVIRKYGMPVEVTKRRVDAWRAALPVQAAAEPDFSAALAAVRDHHLQFWNAMLRATARRVGVRYLLAEDLQDGGVLEGVRFVNPFNPANDAVIDGILSP